MQVNRSTPWFFLTPNLVIFGVFTFLPIAINFYYAFTGGVQLYPRDRPFVGFGIFAVYPIVRWALLAEEEMNMIDIETARIAYRKFGDGPTKVVIEGAINSCNAGGGISVMILMICQYLCMIELDMGIVQNHHWNELH